MQVLNSHHNFDVNREISKHHKADTEIVIHDEIYAWLRVIFKLSRWPALILFGFPADQNIYPAFHKFWKRFQLW